MMPNPHEPYLTRRSLLKAGCVLGLSCLASPALLPPTEASTRYPHNIPSNGVREALFYQPLEGGMVHCTLCPCRPDKGYCGFLRHGDVCACRVRFCHNGKLYTSTYGQVASIHKDPIEKNPVFHAYPGSKSLAFGTAGCNMECKGCQNWQLAQKGVERVHNLFLPPAEIIRMARKYACNSISYTFTEPVVFYEFVHDTAKLAQHHGLKNCLVTGGYINEQPARLLGRLMDTVSISIKALSEQDYRRHCKGSLNVIKKAALAFRASGAWLEIVFLPIPTISDNLQKLAQVTDWIYRNLGPDTPIHFSRFFPEYRLRYLPPTPIRWLEQAREQTINQGFRYVYIGNVAGHDANNTYCPGCSKLLIQRLGFKILKNKVNQGRCAYCRYPIPGLWS